MNKLYYGDNLDVLRNKLPAESVDLCYIDPPFNSKRNYFQIYNNIGKEDTAQAQAFVDTWKWNELALRGFQEIITNEGGRYTRQTIELLKGLRAVLGDSGLLSYMISMTQRVNEIWRVLKPTASFYLHCDPTASHYLKLILDSIFCARGGDFLNEITWKRTSAHSDAKRFGANADIILFYTKSDQYVFSTIHQQYSAKYLSRFRNEDIDGRLWADGDLSAKGLAGGGYEYEYKGVKSLWRCPYATMERLDNEGRLHFTHKGGIRLKKYLDELEGLPPQSIWEDINPLNSQARERLGYPTQKPEALMERIIQASSNEGDVVLDTYCGCGTTLAVAERLRRKWIGIDITYQSIALIIKRLEDSFGAEIMQSVSLDGIPRDMESASALAQKKDDRLRKEFEKWALLTYSNNRAMVNNKKGADKGVDGVAYFMTGADSTERVIFQVKSGNVKRNDIATLRGDMLRENAELAIFITLKEPTNPMREEAVSAGFYHHALLNRDYPRIQIVTIQELIEEGRRIDLPLSVAVLKSAKATIRNGQKNLL